jgi:integrase
MPIAALRDTTIAPNIVQTTRADGTIHGFRVYIRIPDPITGKSRKIGTRFPPATSIEKLTKYRDDGARAAYAPDDTATGFTADARRYLAHPQVVAMPAFATRLIEIEKWIGILGDTPRDLIDTSRVDAELQRLKTAGYANSTVNKFRTALMSLWTRLDGRAAANPVRDAIMFEEAPLTARGQSYDLLTLILDDIQDERGKAWDRATLYREVWIDPATTVAARYAVSSTFLKRICARLLIPTPPRGYWAQSPAAREPRPALPRGGARGVTPELLKARARLEVLTFTGMDPGQLGRMDPATDLDLVAGWYTPPFRKKGSRRRRTARPVIRLPLVDQAPEAFRRLIAVNGWGEFDANALLKTWLRACRRVEKRLRVEYGDPRFTIPHIRLKDLRHSFGTKAFEDTGDLTTVGQMLQHAPGSPMTIRYSLGAVPSVLRSKMAKFSGGESRRAGLAAAGTARTKVVPITRNS